MKKFLLIVFILIDIFVITLAAMFLIGNVKGTQPAILRNLPIPAMSKPVTQTTAAVTTTPSSVQMSTATPSAISPITPVASSVTSTATSRKILFSYRNSKAKKVMIRADFTGWRAEPMEKKGVAWEYTAALEPGEYAYCYSVDDKSIRDPAAKHTKTVGKTVVSAIIVQPAPAVSH